jgi:hypothetical protein
MEIKMTQEKANRWLQKQSPKTEEKILLDEEYEAAVHLIKIANDAGKGSTGQFHLAKFIRACLNYSDRANIKEILYREDIERICALLKIAQSDELLRKLVEEHNPTLLKGIEE